MTAGRKCLEAPELNALCLAPERALPSRTPNEGSVRERLFVFACVALSCPCSSVPSKVMPDLHVGAREAGAELGREEQACWLEYCRLFLAAPSAKARGKAKAEAKAKAKAKAKDKAAGPAKAKAKAKAETKGDRLPTAKTVQWKSAWRELKAIDYVLSLVLGVGLEHFSPGPEDGALLDRPTLAFHLDEGSSGYTMCWYLQYHLGLRTAVVRDVFHREWNDIKGALADCSLWWVVLLTTLAFNLNHGPWNNEAWWQEMKEGSKEVLALEQFGNPLWQSFYPWVCRDRDEPQAGTAAHQKQLLEDTRKSKLFDAKGERVATKRWFSWLKSAHYHRGHWHTQLFLLLGATNGHEATQRFTKASYVRPWLAALTPIPQSDAGTGKAFYPPEFTH